MTEQTPPAGWYDDPAGTGGRRYWNGGSWTERTQAAPGSGSTSTRRRTGQRDRLPDDYMLLNGHAVRIGETNLPSARSSHRGMIVAIVIALAILLVFAISWVLVANSPDDVSPVRVPDSQSSTLSRS